MKKLLLVLSGGLLLGGCKEATYLEPADPGRGYFPAEVGRYRIYQVFDTTWLNYAPTPRAYQVREQLVSSYLDAASQPVFRVESARRADSGAAWVADSAFTLSVDERRVVYTRGTRRSVELVFPVRDELAWNLSAYANTTQTDVADTTRKYVKGTNGQPFTLPAVPGYPAKAFSKTLTTANIGSAAAENNCTRRTYRQVFAEGVGPVYRRSVNFDFQNTVNNTCEPELGPNQGASHTEVLVESGP